MPSRGVSEDAGKATTRYQPRLTRAPPNAYERHPAQLVDRKLSSSTGTAAPPTRELQPNCHPTLFTRTYARVVPASTFIATALPSAANPPVFTFGGALLLAYFGLFRIGVWRPRAWLQAYASGRITTFQRRTALAAPWVGGALVGAALAQIAHRPLSSWFILVAATCTGTAAWIGWREPKWAAPRWLRIAHAADLQVAASGPWLTRVLLAFAALDGLASTVWLAATISADLRFLLPLVAFGVGGGLTVMSRASKDP